MVREFFPIYKEAFLPSSRFDRDSRRAAAVRSPSRHPARLRPSPREEPAFRDAYTLSKRLSSHKFLYGFRFAECSCSSSPSGSFGSRPAASCPPEVCWPSNLPKFPKNQGFPGGWPPSAVLRNNKLHYFPQNFKSFCTILNLLVHTLFIYFY